MTPKISAVVEEVLKTLKVVDLEKSDVTVCLASQTDQDGLPEIQLLPITDLLGNEFRDIVSKTFSSVQDSDKVFRRYEGGSKPDSHEIEYLSISKHPAIAKQLQVLASLADLPFYNPVKNDGLKHKDPFTDDLRFYVIVIQPPNSSRIICFRVYGASKELTRSKKFGAMFADGQFDAIRVPTLLFDNYIDCITVDDVALILKQSNFHRIFQFFEAVLKTAGTTLSAIKTQIPIANFSDFESACQGHLQKLSKLRNISQKPYFPKITIKHLKKVISEFDLKIEVKKVDGEEQLIFDPKDKWAILRLLDDDYLLSADVISRAEPIREYIYHTDNLLNLLSPCTYK